MPILQKKTSIPQTVLLIWVCGFTLIGCKSLRYNITNRDIQKEIKKSAIFEEHFAGFTLYDPEANRYLCNLNDHLPYTPASNIKVLTTLACLENLGDSIATFKYTRKNDSLIIKPLADPTFLHPDFTSQKAADFLRSQNTFVSLPKTYLSKYGPGWAWDDYEYGFQPEKSWFPAYGNVIRIFNENDSLAIVPSFFLNYTQMYVGERPGNLIYRAENANIFNAWLEHDTSSYERQIPFIHSNELLAALLYDSLQTRLTYIDTDVSMDSVLYSQDKNLTLTMMMHPSDNFMAEHLLLHCALMNGFESTTDYRKQLQKEWSSFLPDGMRWVDGSGLSRYNLITPRNMVSLLNRIYQIEEWENITCIFPTGGVSGTLKNWYKSDTPYLYAKTGTLSNNHSISGYLVTDSGKKLIFSFMNNHYLGSSTHVKVEMEKLFAKIKEAY
jgi:D-alanyl-D-alanine carboxypeptidase/D-alanyl-D-alanine-endopeptidase (penicillin-binding protein 4)